MPVSTALCVPTHIELGTTVRFQVSFSDFPASEWTAALELQLNTDAPTSVAATAADDAFLFVLSAAVTDALTPGTYNVAIYVTEISSSEVARAYGGIVRCDKNVSEAQTASFNRQLLSDIDTALSSLATGTNQSVNVNGQSYTKKDVTSLYALRVQVKAAVIMEENAEEDATNSYRSTNYQPNFGPAFPAWPYLCQPPL